MVGRTGLWSLTVERRSPADLDGQVFELLGLLSPDLAIWSDLATFQGELFLGLFLQDGNEGITIGRDAIAAIAARGLRLDMDIYAAGQ